jgi:hypothetical protein
VDLPCRLAAQLDALHDGMTVAARVPQLRQDFLGFSAQTVRPPVCCPPGWISTRRCELSLYRASVMPMFGQRSDAQDVRLLLRMQCAKLVAVATALRDQLQQPHLRVTVWLPEALAFVCTAHIIVACVLV